MREAKAQALQAQPTGKKDPEETVADGVAGGVERLVEVGDVVALLGGAAGILLAAATAATLASLLDASAISDWGWRLPFIAGSGIAVLGLYVRSSMPETPQFEAMKAEKDS